MAEDHNQFDVPRLVAWELTRRCNLNCIHCRAAASRGPHPGELDSRKCREVMDQIAELGRPIVILTGGEPLLREDVFELAAYGSNQGLRMVMATNGTLITGEVLEKIRQAGIQRVSISIDGADEEQHDRFRMMPGAFEGAVGGARRLKEAGIAFQINTTVTRHNLSRVREIMNLAENLGAVAHHLFLLVPTGRAREMVDQEIDARAYENLLRWFYRVRGETRLHLKATCAPHYYRILRQEARARGETVDFAHYGLDAVTRGCLGGTGFCFIAYDGVVQPCGYLEVNCGDLRRAPFGTIWRESPVFDKLRDYGAYKGKCGRCAYLRFCGGCRARAYEATGDFMAEEPLCLFQPGQAAAV